MSQLVLASASPRRRALLSRVGFDFEVVPSAIDESIEPPIPRPERLARRLARAKALDVAASRPRAFVLAADTIVVHRGAVLCKPLDAEEARRMLKRLRDRRHRVITAVGLGQPLILRLSKDLSLSKDPRLSKEGRRPVSRIRVAHVISAVLMRPYDDSEIEASIARGDPFDKAGAYAIQDPVFQPVAAYDRCYCNVVGLPLWTTLRLLQDAGLVPSREPDLPSQCETCPLKALSGDKEPLSAR